MILANGSLYAIGKGSYGRLGVGDSTNHSAPQRVKFGEDSEPVKIKMVCRLSPKLFWSLVSFIAVSVVDGNLNEFLLIFLLSLCID